MARSKSKDSAAGKQVSRTSSGGKEKQQKPGIITNTDLKKKAFKEGMGDNDNNDTPANKKYPHR